MHLQQSRCRYFTQKSISEKTTLNKETAFSCRSTEGRVVSGFCIGSFRWSSVGCFQNIQLGSASFSISFEMSCSYSVPRLPVPPPAATVRWYSQLSCNQWSNKLQVCMLVWDLLTIQVHLQSYYFVVIGIYI